MPAQLTPQRAQDFYGEHKGKSFFETLVNFMTSGPVYALVLAKQNAIKEWRSLMGPTNSNTARAEKPKRYCILDKLQSIATESWLAGLLLQALYNLLFAHVLLLAAEVALLGNKVWFCSLRALYGTDGTQNATHGSDSPASAAREIRFFFPQLSQVDMPYRWSISADSCIPQYMLPEVLKFATCLSRSVHLYW